MEFLAQSDQWSQTLDLIPAYGLAGAGIWTALFLLQRFVRGYVNDLQNALNRTSNQNEKLETETTTLQTDLITAQRLLAKAEIEKDRLASKLEGALADLTVVKKQHRDLRHFVDNMFKQGAVQIMANETEIRALKLGYNVLSEGDEQESE